MHWRLMNRWNIPGWFWMERFRCGWMHKIVWIFVKINNELFLWRKNMICGRMVSKSNYNNLIVKK